ncbi:MAG: glycosyltransferase family 39 protein [Candidatus Omnitrophica bacterium]|nr:glycosyltransferase family 39 protein [Candidatus Omnitrophota bacterium]
MKKKDLVNSGFLSLFSFFILFFFRATEQTGDSLNYLYCAKTGENLFHPHHLLFNPAVRIFYLLFSYIFKNSDVLLSAQIHNIIWAVITVLSVYFIIDKISGSKALSLLASLSWNFCLGFWFLSTQAETYVAALGCISLIILILAKKYEKIITTRQYLSISCLFILGVLYHQMMILFFIPMTIYFLFCQKRNYLRIFLINAFVSVIAIVLIYVAAFYFSRKGLEAKSFYYYATLYWHNPVACWGKFNHFNLLTIKQFIFSQLWNFIAVPLKFKNIFIYIFLVLKVFLIIWHVVSVFKKKPFYKIRLALIVFLLVHSLFCIWWLPEETEFPLISAWALLILGFIFLNDISEISRRKLNPALFFLISLMVFGLAFRNYTTIISGMHKNKGKSYDRACQLARLNKEGCILFEGHPVIYNYKFYFNKKAIVDDFDALVSFYNFKQPLINLDGKTCLFVSLDTLSPRNNFTGANGYLKPKEWLLFIEWLFAVEKDKAGIIRGCREFQVIVDPLKKDEVFLKLGSKKTAVDGLADMLSRLDKMLEPYLKEEYKNIFTRWLNDLYLKKIKPTSSQAF